MPACGQCAPGFLKLFCVDVCMCTCICVCVCPPLRLLITSSMILEHFSWIFQTQFSFVYIGGMENNGSIIMNNESVASKTINVYF